MCSFIPSQLEAEMKLQSLMDLEDLQEEKMKKEMEKIALESELMIITQ